MKRYIRASTVDSPAEYLRDNFPRYDKGMRTYGIEGKTITTNYLAYNKPSWNGYSKARGYVDGKYAEWGHTDELFDQLISEGYTEIKLVEVSTSIHGLRRTYMWYK